MDWTLFQLACLAVLALAYLALYRQTPRERRRELTTLIALILVSSWAAEETSILRYAFYGYPDSWWVKLDEVPLLVVLIWPLVVLTADHVVRALFPNLGRLRHALAIGLMVFIDASLVETVAVAADLWSWVEGGYLGAPLIGLVGWGAYAFSIALFLPSHQPPPTPSRLDALAEALHSPSPWPSRLLVLALSLAVTHALLVATWWLFFRHALRDHLPTAAAWGVLVASAALTLMLVRRPHRIPIATSLPRAAATSIFIFLLVVYADGPPLYIHFFAIALPYLALTRWRVRPSTP